MTKLTHHLSLCFFFLVVAACGPKEIATSTAETPIPSMPEETAGLPGETDTALRIEIPNARLPVPGVLTGGQPTPEQLEEAAAAGYVTVVNLRPPGEQNTWDEAAKAAELGLRYVNLPIKGAQDLSEANAVLLSKVVDDIHSQPVMVHCASGNRVGALFALKAHFVEGKDAASALQQGRDAGLKSLEEAVKERLAESE